MVDYRVGMPSFRILFTVVSTLVLAQVFPARILWPADKAGLLLAAVSLAVLCICKQRARALVRQAVAIEPFNPGLFRIEVAAKFDSTRHIVQSFWGWCYPLVLAGTGWLSWAATVKESGWYFLFAICLFAPHLLFCVILEWLAAQMDRFCGENLWDRWRLRLRFGELSSVLVCLCPLWLISAVVDLTAFSLGHSVSVGLQIAFATAMLILVMGGYPIVFGKWTGITHLTKAEQSLRCEDLVRRIGIRHCRIVEVPSGDTWTSAAILGWIPWTRQLWLGDALLKRVSARELDMVVLHEVAHIRCRHFAYRLLPIVWAVFAATGTLLILTHSFGAAWWQGTIALFGAAAILLVGMGVVSRGCELEADVKACELASQFCDWTGGEWKVAQETLLRALRKTVEPEQESVRSWLHPSLKERISHLANAGRKRRKASEQSSVAYL